MATNGMDEAAQAFTAEIATEGPATPTPKGDKSNPAESVFPNLGVPEVDEESPEKGGGDEDAIYEDGEPEAEEDEESEDEDEGSEEDAEESDEDLGTKYKITVDGEEAEVTVKE